MRVVLVRHPPVSVEPGICYGRLDLPLTAEATTGLPEFARNPAFGGAAHIWSSPARRCRTVAEAIASWIGCPASYDPRLLELDFGQWEGRAWSMIDRSALDRWAADPVGFSAPAGEAGTALIARVQDFHAAILQDGGNCIVVSHGGPLKVLAALLGGDPIDLLVPAPALGSVTTIMVSRPAGTRAAARGR